MHKRQVVTNALMAGLQVLVSGVALFVLYRYFLNTIGADLFGVWSVVLATTAVGGVAKAGLHGSMTKFVAQYRARNDDAHAARIVQTAALTIIVVVGVIAVILSFILPSLLVFVIKEPHLHTPALEILPYALLSFWLTALSSIYQSSIDGMQRVDLQNLLVMLTTILYVGLCFYFVPRNGLVGLARAQVIQNIVLLLLSMGMMTRLLTPLPPIPLRWSWSALKEVFVYSVNFQLLSISQMLFMPMTKMILARLGGAGSVAFYEMANKMAFQIRSLISMGHQALVPTIADLTERAPEQLRLLYASSMQTMVFFIIALLPPLLYLLPTISIIWIGYYEPVFVHYGIFLLTGWFLNLLVNPAYFNNMGTGHLKWNVIGHFVTVGANLGLGILLGLLMGPIGVIIGFAVSIQLGTLATTGAYHRHHTIRARSIIRKADVWFFFSACMSVTVAWSVRQLTQPLWTFPWIDFLCLITVVLVMLPAFLRHPMLPVLYEWLASLRPRPRLNP